MDKTTLRRWKRMMLMQRPLLTMRQAKAKLAKHREELHRAFALAAAQARGTGGAE